MSYEFPLISRDLGIKTQEFHSGTSYDYHPPFGGEGGRLNTFCIVHWVATMYIVSYLESA